MSRARALAVGLWGVAAAGVAQAASGDGNASSLLWTAFNLAVLLAVIVYFARKPLATFFTERRDTIRSELEEAESLRREVEGRFADWQRKLVDLDQEIQQLRSGVIHRAEAEGERIRADARASAERMRREAAAAIDQELRRSRQALREEAAELAVTLAGELLGQSVEMRDHERLVDEFVAKVEQSSHGAGS